MAKFRIKSPSGEEFEINAPDNATEDQVLAYAQEQFAKKPPTSLIRGAGLVASGMAAPTIGAIAGGYLGGPVGALAGSLAVPAADLLTYGYNALAPDQYDIGLPSEAVGRLLTKAGLPVPETRMERSLETGGAMLGGAGGQLKALTEIAKTGATATGRGIAAQLSQQPARQLAAALPSGVAAQYTGESVTEATGSPVVGQIAGLAAGVGASAPFAIGASRIQEKVPTVGELKSLAGKEYKFAEQAGAVFKKNAVNKFATELEPKLKKEGFHSKLHPKVSVALEEIKNASKGDLTLEDAEILRRIGNSAKGSIDADERRLGGILIDSLDDFVEGAQPSQLKSGSKEAMEALKNARDLWSRSKKGEILQDIFDVAELRAGTNFTQSGMEQALRSRLTNLATNARKMRAFTKEEQALIKSTAKGGSMQNILRWAGKYAPTSVIPTTAGAVLGSMAGGTAGAGVGALAVPAIGATSRYGATQIGLKNFQDLQNRLLLGRTPQQNISPASALALGAAGRESLYPVGLLSPELEE